MTETKLREHQCPRCGHYVPNDVTPGEYPGALSRYDNATEVCSQCGADEAMIQWLSPDKKLEKDREQWFVVTGRRHGHQER